MLLIDSDSVKSVHVELWEPNLELLLAEYDLSEAEIAEGEAELPGFDTAELYFAHMDEYEALYAEPEVEMRVEMVYDSAEGEQRVSMTQRSEYELGWTFRYWPEDGEDYEWTRPGWFEFTTYETPMKVSFLFDKTSPLSMTTTEKNGVPEVTAAMRVSFSIDGREITEDECEYVLENAGEWETTDGETITFYNAKLYFPRMDWMPEKGTVHVKIEQILTNFSSTWISEKDFEYEF